MSRKLWLGVSAGAVGVLVVAAVVIPRLWTVSTHHCQIRVLTPEGQEDGSLRQKEFEQVLGIVEEWAGRAGFDRPPDGTQSSRQSWFSSDAKGNERIISFREEPAKGESFATELMIVCEPDGPTEIQIMISEGYSRHPSKQLHGIYDSLLPPIERCCPGRVRGSIW